MKVGGRIVDALVSLDARFPMIVQSNHSVTQLLIASYHQETSPCWSKSHSGSTEREVLDSKREVLSS